MPNEGQGRSLRFRVDVDDAGLAKLEQAAERLKNVAREISQAFGPISGMFGGSTRVGAPGSPNSAGSASVGGSGGGSGGSGGSSGGGGGAGGGGGFADTITKSLIANKNLLRGVATESRDVARVMEDALKSSISKQIEELKRLKSEVKSLGNEYKELGHSQGEFSHDPKDVAPRREEIRGEMVSKQTEIQKRQENIGKLEGMAGGGGGGGGGLGGLVKGLAGMLGVPANVLTGAGMMAAGVGLAKYSYSSVSTLGEANLNYRMHQPFMAAERGAGYGSTFGSAGMALHGGDVGRAAALRMAMRDPETRKLFSFGADITRQKLMERQAGMGMSGTDRFVDRFAQGIAEDKTPLATSGSGHRGLTGHLYEMFNGPGAGTDTRAQISMAEQINALGPAKAADFVRMADLKAQQNQRLFSVYNEAYGGALGEMSAMRGAGVGSGRYILGGDGAQTTGIGGDAFSEWSNKILHKGFSPGEAAALRQQVSASAGRGLMGAGDGMLGAASGGFGNIAQIFGVGAQFGGGRSAGGDAMISAVQRRGIGGGGVDITAGSGLASMIAAQMTGGNFMMGGGRGISAMEGTMAAGFTGTPGEDMRMARVLQGGMGALGSSMAGGTDGLQQGINMISANQAAGGKGWYAKQALMRLGPAQMLDILRSGKVPDLLQDQGVSIDDVRKYAGSRNQYEFSRYIDAEGGGSRVAGAVRGVKESGSVGAYLHAQLGKVKAGSTKGREVISRQLRMLASALPETMGSLEDREGALRLEASSDPSLMPTLKSGGAGDVVSKFDPHRTAAASQGDELVSKNKLLIKNIGDFTLNAKTLVGQAEMFDTATAKLVSGAKDFDQALQTVTDSLLKTLWRLDPGAAAKIAIQRKEAERKLQDANTKTEAAGKR